MSRGSVSKAYLSLQRDVRSLTPKMRIIFVAALACALLLYLDNARMARGLDPFSLMHSTFRTNAGLRPNFGASLWDDLSIPPENSLHDRMLMPETTYITQPVPVGKRAIVSTLYDNLYSEALHVLGHSLKLVGAQADLACLYIPGQVDPSVLAGMKKLGWTMIEVDRIEPPHAGTADQFRDQFTKLHIFNLTQYEAVFYMDADTIAVRNFDEIWSVPSDFAAVPDIYMDHRGFTINFNAGVMYLRPSREIFDDMMTQLPIMDFERPQAEQSFLNEYMRYTVWRLPYKYNGNLAIKLARPDAWKELMSSVAIIHYTWAKPFKVAEHEEDGSFGPEFALWWRVKRALEATYGMLEA